MLSERLTLNEISLKKTLKHGKAILKIPLKYEEGMTTH